jgi:hypothetical protein
MSFFSDSLTNFVWHFLTEAMLLEKTKTAPSTKEKPDKMGEHKQTG